MRQLFLLIFISLTGIILSSCSDKDETQASDTLSGTYWSQTFADGTHYALSFGIGQGCVFSWRSPDSGPTYLNGRYSCRSDEVTVELYSREYTGHIEGDVLYIYLSARDLALRKQ